MAGVTSVVLGGAALLGLNEQRKGRKEAKKAAKEANRIARRQEELSSARNRIGALRHQRRLAAAARNQAANAGVQGSSAVQGAIGSLASDTASNISFANQQDELGAQSLRAQADAFKAQERIAIGQTVQQQALRGISIGG